MYRKKLFLNFFLVFAVFAITISLLQYNRERDFKIDKLNSNLANYTDIVYSYIRLNSLHLNGKYHLLDSLYEIIGKKNLRITIISTEGNVLYDSDVVRHDELENHLARPEVYQAITSEYGTNIRESRSTGTPYYYYAKRYSNFFIRTAINYDHDIISFLKAEKMFFIVIIFLFFIMSLFIVYISGRFGKTLSKLKDFSLKAARDEQIDPDIEFPENELGVISKQIVSIYDNLKKTRDAIKMEKEKLIRHLYVSKEGIAIFSADKTRILSNSLFIQIINFISSKPALNPEQVFKISEFREVNLFIDNMLKSGDENFWKAELPARSFFIEKRGRYFSVHVIIFSDRAFEISINDITTQEQEKRIKQQLTSNIAHELRTPVSSITGYLETLTRSKDMGIEKQAYFIEKAYKQSIRLSELIADISELNRIEEGAMNHESEDVDISEIVSDVTGNLEPKFSEKGITVKLDIAKGTSIKGKYSFIYSIFQNLFENSITHGGDNITAGLNKYFEDDNYHYFLYYDTGKGIPEKHIERVFERFYRVDKGRRRKSGGTGLGLAIIKNAIMFHNGDITAKTREGGGVEFIFSLRKTPEIQEQI
jgi:two-component system, OmpR family, phosphate regulon sensor histidine kinase PhoR